MHARPDIYSGSQPSHLVNSCSDVLISCVYSFTVYIYAAHRVPLAGDFTVRDPTPSSDLTDPAIDHPNTNYLWSYSALLK